MGFRKISKNIWSMEFVFGNDRYFFTVLGDLVRITRLQINCCTTDAAFETEICSVKMGERLYESSRAVNIG